MFWKKSDNWSLTNRLTIQYALVFAAIVFVTAYVVYATVEHNINKQNGIALKDYFYVIEKIIESRPGSRKALYKEVIQEPQLTHNKVLLRVLNQNKHIIIETPGFDKLATPDQFPSVTSGDEHYSETKDVAYGHSTYRIQTHKITVGNFDFTIQIAIDVTRDIKTLNELNWYLLSLLLIGTSLAMFTALFFTRRGLKPLNRIVKDIAKIDLQNLGNHLKTQDLPQEIKLLATTFNSSLVKIAESYQRLSQFSADIAHELRTPINNLVLASEVNLAKSLSNEQLYEFIGENLTEYHNLNNLIEQMLFLARAENSKLKLAQESIDLNHLFQDLLEYYELSASEKNISFIYSGNAEITADRSLLRQAFSNLISNAIKYSEAETNIEITIKNQQHQTIIVIRDHGCGIAPEHLPKIFDRFYRVSFDRNKKTGGTGLGLAIVMSIIELHGGTIQVESGLNVGTTFTIQLP